MCKEKSKFSTLACLNYAIFLVIFCLPFTTCADIENYAYHINPTTVRQFSSSYRPSPDAEYYNEGYFTQKGPELVKSYPSEKVFQIEPSDAIDINKYSQPAVGQMNILPGLKVPSMTLPSDRVSMPALTQNHKNFSKLKPAYDGVPKNISKPMRDSRFIESATDQSPKSSSGSKSKFENEDIKDMQSDMSFKEHVSNLDSQNKNNFTNSDTNLLPVSSDAILSYHIPSNNKNIGTIKNYSNMTPELDVNISSHSFEKPIPNPTVIITSTPSELITETAIIFNTYQIDVFNQTDSVDFATIIPSNQDNANFSSGMPLLNSGHEKLSSGSVAGIVVAVLVCVTLLSSAVIYLLYRKYNGKCTSVVDGKFNTDNCGYLDDSLRSSIYLNNHIELPKESSEEMSSLDNDSFLNSLETMTIQNYWADNSKNTKV